MATKTNTHSDVMEKQEAATRPQVPPKFNVVFLNDDFTPFEFVIESLVEIFGKDVDTAEGIAMLIHMDGRGVCGTYIKEIAELKQTKTMRRASAEGHPLQCLIEPAAPSPGRSGPKP